MTSFDMFICHLCTFKMICLWWSFTQLFYLRSEFSLNFQNFRKYFRWKSLIRYVFQNRFCDLSFILSMSLTEKLLILMKYNFQNFGYSKSFYFLKKLFSILLILALNFKIDEYCFKYYKIWHLNIEISNGVYIPWI